MPASIPGNNKDYQSLRKILPGIYTFTGLMAGRVYMIEDPDGLTIIDAGLSLAPPRILEQFAASGYAPVDVKRILITHAHPDHVGGLQALQKATGAQVYASVLEKPIIADEQPIIGPPSDTLPGLFRFMPRPTTIFPPTPVERTLRGGDVLNEVLGGLRVVDTPGHAPGHVSYYDPKTRVLFGGDVIMSLWPNHLRLPIRFVTTDMEQDIESIHRVAALDVRVLCLGHGIPIVENTNDIIREYVRSLDMPKLSALGSQV